jgi:hypothetical protein
LYSQQPSGRHSRTNGVWDADIPISHPNSLNGLGVVAFVSIPVKLKANTVDGADAALTFYRRSGFFTDAEYSELERAAQLFPAVYRAIHERTSLILLRQVQAVLRKLHFPPNQVNAKQPAREALDQVLGIIDEYFQFLETSLYLHDPEIDPPERFTRVAGKWPWRTAPEQYCYPGGLGMAQVLRTSCQLRFLDIASSGQTPENFRQLYGTKAPFDVRKAVQESLNLPEGEGFPLTQLPHN